MAEELAHTEIYADQVKLLYRHVPVTVLYQIVNAAILIFVAQEAVNSPAKILWVGAFLSLMSARGILWIAFQNRKHAPENMALWARTMGVISFLSGMVWGWAGWVFMPVGMAMHDLHLFIAMIIVVMACVEMNSQYPVLRTYVMFVVPMIVLVAARFFSFGEDIHVAMGAVALLLMVLLMIFAKHHRDGLIKTLRLRLENRALVKKLAFENEEMRAENVEIGSMETLLRQKTDVLDAVSQVQSQFIAEREPHVIFSQTLDIILHLTGSELGFIGEVLQDGNGERSFKAFAITDVAWNEDTDQLYDPASPMGMAFQNLDSVFGMVLKTGEPAIDNQLGNDSSACGFPPNYPAPKTFLGVPLYLGENMVGLIGLANRRDGYNDEVLTALDPVISAAANMVDGLRNRRERDEAQVTASRAMERLTTAIESLNDGFVIFDSDDRLALCNSKYKALYKETHDLLVPGTRFEDILRAGVENGQFDVSVDEAEEWICTRMALHRQAESLLEQKLADGTWLRIDERATPDGGRVGFRVDITELKRTQDDLKNAVEQAETANRAKSEFLSSMSHELRTPMNAVLGFAQLLMLNPQLPLDPKQRDSVEQILKGGNHLLELINEILDLSRIEAGRINLAMEDMDPHGVIEECIAYITPLAQRRSIDVDSDIPKEKYFTIHADPTRFKQVLLNLLSNAVKYNVEGGSVIFSAHVDETGFIRFSVSDTGPGIPQDKYEEIFEPFSRLGKEHTNIEGTGIGLTITRKLAELMGGTLDFESVMGEGSKFWIDLPGRQAEAPQVKVSEAVKDEFPTLPRGVHQVLYVEDNPDNLRLMEHVITMVDGVDLISAHTGELGLEMAAIHQPDVILMDINLPGINGIEALKRLRALPETSAIPVIAISADAMPADIKRGLQVGFDAYLTKPINLAEVIDHIKRALEGEFERGHNNDQNK